jgi:hypothetical protein
MFTVARKNRNLLFVPESKSSSYRSNPVNLGFGISLQSKFPIDVKNFKDTNNKEATFEDVWKKKLVPEFIHFLQWLECFLFQFQERQSFNLKKRLVSFMKGKKSTDCFISLQVCSPHSPILSHLASQNGHLRIGIALKKVLCKIFGRSKAWQPVAWAKVRQCLDTVNIKLGKFAKKLLIGNTRLFQKHALIYFIKRQLCQTPFQVCHQQGRNERWLK